MKICLDCQFHKRVPVDMGNGSHALGSACSNSECRDPVNGAELPCVTARSNESFCGLKVARHFKQKEDEKKDTSEVSNLIKLK